MVVKKSGGRPISKNPRSNRVEVKLNADEIEKLNYCVAMTGYSRGKIIREGVDVVYSRLTQEQKL
jgi:hypothetical protein